MEQVGEVCWLGGFPMRKGLGSRGLWGTQQSFIWEVGEGSTPREVQPLNLLYTIFDRKAGLDKNLNSSLSFGQAALTFRLPRATFCLSQLKISLAARGWVIWTLAHWASKLQKLLAQQENPLVLDYWTRIFSNPVWEGTPFVCLLLTNGTPFASRLTAVNAPSIKYELTQNQETFMAFSQPQIPSVSPLLGWTTKVTWMSDINIYKLAPQKKSHRVGWLGCLWRGLERVD